MTRMRFGPPPCTCWRQLRAERLGGVRPAARRPLPALVPAVERRSWGPKEVRYSYSDWAHASLYAAGLDPAAVPPWALPAVLDLLVTTGRTVPGAEMIDSVRRAGGLAQVRGIMAAQKSREAPATGGG